MPLPEVDESMTAAHEAAETAYRALVAAINRAACDYRAAWAAWNSAEPGTPAHSVAVHRLEAADRSQRELRVICDHARTLRADTRKSERMGRPMAARRRH